MSLDKQYNVRISAKLKLRYIKHCGRKLDRDHTDVTREMMQAVVDGRLKITPTENQKNSLGELYNVD